jgi:hypothetical protein
VPTAHTSQTPAAGDVNTGAAITTGVRFTVASAVTVSAIAFWVPGTNSGTYTGGLYQTTADDDPAASGTGTLLTSASVGSGSVTAGTWASIPITPQTLSTGTVYTAAVHSSSGRIVATSTGLASSISNGGVTLLANGSDPNPPGLGSLANGVFVVGAALAYPVSVFNSTDYFVDVELTSTVEANVSLTATAAVTPTAAVDRPATTTLTTTAEVTPTAAVDRAANTTLTATATITATAAVERAASATLTVAATVTSSAEQPPANATSTVAVTAGRTSTAAVAANRTSTPGVT